MRNIDTILDQLEELKPAKRGSEWVSVWDDDVACLSGKRSQAGDILLRQVPKRRSPHRMTLRYEIESDSVAMGFDSVHHYHYRGFFYVWIKPENQVISWEEADSRGWHMNDYWLGSKFKRP